MSATEEHWGLMATDELASNLRQLSSHPWAATEYPEIRRVALRQAADKIESQAEEIEDLRLQLAQALTVLDVVNDRMERHATPL